LLLDAILLNINKVQNSFQAFVFFLGLLLTFGGMASKGLRVISCQVTQKVEAGYNPSHTSETLIGYTACVRPA
jgi:hypothetical protein